MNFELDRNSPISLSDQIANQIRQKIVSGEYKVGHRLPTLSQMESGLGVGVGTVRKAFDRLAREGAIAKKPRIGTIVQPFSEVGGNSAETSIDAVTREKLKELSVAVVGCESIYEDYPGGKRHARVAEAFEAELSTMGGRSVLAGYVKDESFEKLGAAVAGANAIFYIAGFDHGEGVLEYLLSQNLPIVVCDYNGIRRVNMVREDWEWATREAILHLISLGHEKIALASYRTEGVDAVENWPIVRENAFLQTMQSEKLEISENDIYRGVHYFPNLSDPAIIDIGKELGETIFDSGKGYTAIIGINDYIAIGIHEVAQKRGIRVPEDLSLVGFDNLRKAQKIGLTTLIPSNEADGRTAARMLVDMFLNPGRSTIMSAVNKPTLVIRTSTSSPCGRKSLEKE